MLLREKGGNLYPRRTREGIFWYLRERAPLQGKKGKRKARALESTIGAKKEDMERREQQLRRMGGGEYIIT